MLRASATQNPYYHVHFSDSTLLHYSDRKPKKVLVVALDFACEETQLQTGVSDGV
jgi:hypothetical protein